MKTYLEDKKSKIETAADDTGKAIKGFTDDDNIGTYFATFCKEKYKAGQDYVQDQLDNQDGGEGTAQCLKAGSKQCNFIHLLPIHICADDR